MASEQLNLSGGTGVRITRLHAWFAVHNDDPDDEGLVAFGQPVTCKHCGQETGTANTPFVASTDTAIEGLQRMAAAIAKQTGQEIIHVVFSDRQDLEVYEGGGPS